MEPVISIRHLFKAYGSKQVLKDINLEVYPGQVIGYIGPNGAGKSTTVKILCELLTDYKGDIRIKEHDQKKKPLKKKRHIGYVPELPELYDVLPPLKYLHFKGSLYGMNKKICDKRIR